MPAAPPPAGSDGLPPISTRAFQLIDQGYPVWTAFVTALDEYLTALYAYLGSAVAVVIGQIGE